MLTEMGRASHEILIWSDKKMFMVEAVTVSKMIEFVPVALEANLSTSGVIIEANNPLRLWFGLLLHQLGGKFPFLFIDEGMKFKNQAYLNMLQGKILH